MKVSLIATFARALSPLYCNRGIAIQKVTLEPGCIGALFFELCQNAILKFQKILKTNQYVHMNLYYTCANFDAEISNHVSYTKMTKS